MSEKRSILQSALLLTAAGMALRVVSMLFQIYLTAQIGAAGIGLLQLAMTVGALAITVGALGVRVAAMVLSGEEQGHNRPGGTRRAVQWCLAYAAVVSTAAALALHHAAPTLSAVWIRDLRATNALRMLSLFLPVTVIWSVFDGYFTATGRIGRLVCVEICERLGAIVLTIAMLRIWARGDIERACCGVVFGTGAASCVSLGVITWLYLRDLRHAPRASGKIARRLLRTAVPVGFSDILRGGLGTLEHLLIPRGLVRAGQSSEGAMAAYGTIHGMVFPVLMFPAALLYALSDLLVAELSRCAAQNRKKR
ncbi:MAG: oligosaccharide flippase family protein, partial [Oscillospiraceae bacterium]|nr:oligosaccharide flippase family protein [Oscillospiraceae bacterium]